MTHFIIIGSPRCGTTSLYNYLGVHPQINLARGTGRREVHFFDYSHYWQNGIDWYTAQFRPNTVTGDKSPTMLQHHRAPVRLKMHLPDCRLIVLCRNPVDRAYADYWLARRKKWIQPNISFEKAIDGEQRRLDWELETPRFWKQHFYLSEHHLGGFIERGLYAQHLKRWFEFFPREQFLILQSEPFWARPDVVVRTAWDWLGLKPSSLPVFRNWQNAQYPPMKPATRRALEQRFEKPNRELEEIVSWTW